MSDFLSEDYWVVETRGVNGTLVIGGTFIFLAYFLHPAVEAAYQRVRAYRAWRAIEMRQAVEVTDYSMVAEIFGGRGRWDAARTITALLAVFSLASWGLELSMELAPYVGTVDLLNQPPPVELGSNTEGEFWQVKSRGDLEYDGNWADLPNMEESQAKSRYFMENGGRFSGEISGDIVVAYWDTEPLDTLFYYTESDATTLVGLSCTDGDGHEDVKNVYNGSDETAWGRVYSCDNGPSLTEGLQTLVPTKSATPPTIVMTQHDGKVFLIVEESSSSLSFLYSVWTVGNASLDSTELNHEFHIAATMRLAEAVVTGIVHGETSGGGCFGLLRAFSERREAYDNAVERAVPFGERPNGNSTAEIEDTETIEYGLKVGVNALLCFVWLMLLTSIGVAWSMCLRSSIGMDIYDRDELIRAVSLQGVAPGGTPPSEIRIFVRREDTGNISVVISDTGKAQGPCARLLKRGGEVVEDVEPAPVAATVDQYNNGFGGADVPVGPRTVWLEGVRTGMGRPLPGPDGNYRYPTSVALSASPVPSYAGSSVGTPISSPVRRGHLFVPRGRMGFPEGRGPSAMFDTTYSSGESGDVTPTNRQAVAGGNATASGGGSGATLSTIVGQRPILAISQATSASDIEMPRLGSEGKTPESRGLTRGGLHMSAFFHGSEEDTEESRYSSDNLEMENPERSPTSEHGEVGDE